MLLISSSNALAEPAGFSLKTQPRLVVLHISSHGLASTTIFLCVLLILLSNFSRKFQTLLQDSFSWHSVTTTISLLERNCTDFPFQNHIKYIVACVCFSAINGSNPDYLSALLHVHNPSRTLRSSSDICMLKIQQKTSTRLVVFALCLTLDPTFKIHSQKTLDTALPYHLLNRN